MSHLPNGDQDMGDAHTAWVYEAPGAVLITVRVLISTLQGMSCWYLEFKVRKQKPRETVSNLSRLHSYDSQSWDGLLVLFSITVSCCRKARWSHLSPYSSIGLR